MSSACQNTPEKQPEFIPAIEVKPQPQVQHTLGIIGAVEPIYIMPLKTPFQARIDTGAETSSIDASAMKHFERDGQKWVAFDIVNSATGEKYSFEKKVERQTTVKRIHTSEKRTIVNMNVKFGGKIIKAEFSLAQREKFDYQVLIGRNILTGRAIVDTSLSNTLR